ncbi:MAG: hypothetical protein WBP64_17315 [Nitrososphaeraceae archaeon]
MTHQLCMVKGLLLLKGSTVLMTALFYLFIMSISVLSTIIFITPRFSGQIALFSIVIAMIPPSVLTVVFLKKINQIIFHNTATRVDKYSEK